MTPPRPTTAAAQTAARPPAPAGATRTLESHELLQGQPLLLIRHHGDLYRLQTTRQGKLILTK